MEQECICPVQMGWSMDPYTKKDCYTLPLIYENCLTTIWSNNFISLALIGLMVSLITSEQKTFPQKRCHGFCFGFVSYSFRLSSSRGKFLVCSRFCGLGRYGAVNSQESLWLQRRRLLENFLIGCNIINLELVLLLSRTPSCGLDFLLHHLVAQEKLANFSKAVNWIHLNSRNSRSSGKKFLPLRSWLKFA